MLSRECVEMPRATQLASAVAGAGCCNPTLPPNMDRTRGPAGGPQNSMQWGQGLPGVLRGGIVHSPTSSQGL